jgi:Methylase involved in ubiquinone/menaquinone biosynthesis
MVRLFSKANIDSQATILDLGCGEGRNLRAIKESGYESIIAIDQSPSALDIIRNRYGLQDDQLFCCNIASGLPMLDAASIDVVVCWGLMHYLAKPIETLKEISRVLKNSGKLIISFSSDTEQRATVDAVKSYFNRDSITAILTESGFDINAIGRITDEYLLDEKIESYYWVSATKK